VRVTLCPVVTGLISCSQSLYMAAHATLPWLLPAASLSLLLLPQSCVTDELRSGLLMMSSPPLNSVGRQKMSEPNMSVLAGVSRWALKKPEAAAAGAGSSSSSSSRGVQQQQPLVTNDGLRPRQQCVRFFKH